MDQNGENVMTILTNELKAKLLAVRSAGEAATLLKDAGVDAPMAERLWTELKHKREANGKELSPEELEAISGGADRDWLTDGCAATVEPGSWCGSNDACWYWDVEYAHEPKEICPKCGGYLYLEYRHTGLGSMMNHYKCNNCGYEKDV